MKIFVNAKETDTQATTLAALVESLGMPAQGVAAAIDMRMVPRTAWAETPLAEGAKVTIIKAACGG